MQCLPCSVKCVVCSVVMEGGEDGSTQGIHLFSPVQCNNPAAGREGDLADLEMLTVTLNDFV